MKYDLIIRTDEIRSNCMIILFADLMKTFECYAFNSQIGSCVDNNFVIPSIEKKRIYRIE